MAEYDQQAHTRRHSPSAAETSKKARAAWQERGFSDAKKRLPPHSRAHLIEHGGSTAVTYYLRGYRLGSAARKETR